MADQIPAQIKSMAAMQAKEHVQAYEYPPKPLAKLDADVRVTYTGVCATDQHMIDNDWDYRDFLSFLAMKWLAMSLLLALTSRN